MIFFLGFLTIGFYFYFFFFLRKEEIDDFMFEINIKNKNRETGLGEYLKTIEDYLLSLDYQIISTAVDKKIFRERIPGDIILKWDPYHIEISGPRVVLENIGEIIGRKI